METNASAITGHRPGRSLREALDGPVSEPCAIFLIVVGMMTLGVLMVYSASRTAYATTDSYYFARHLIFVPVALAALVAGTYFPYRWLNKPIVAWSVLGVTILLLGLVLIFGEERNGARRWFVFVLFGLRLSFQPSELAKFGLVIFMAWFFSRSVAEPRSLRRGFLPAIVVLGLVCGLIGKEDFGTAALVGTVATLLCLIAGWRLWFPLILAVPAAIGFYFVVLCEPFRLDRLRVWLDPWQDFDGRGWHVCQSLMGIGNGGLFGTGLGAGFQKLYIPENTTDFIFAVLCEEMGVLGGLLVLGLFAAFVWRAGRVVRSAPDRFAFLLASGILMTIGLQAIMNIGVVTSALPAKGISLPFISYGGSGLVMMGFAAGLLASVARKCEQAASESPLAIQPPTPSPVVYRPAPRDEAQSVGPECA